MLVEGSAGLAVAGLAAVNGLAGRKVVVVLCGANVDPSKLREAL
jgi:threonine dehydratase